MNNLTATRIVKSVLQRTAEFETYRYDYVRAPRDFYERLAEARALAGQWAEPRALELFAALSPAQRAIHIVMDDDAASLTMMRSTVVARQWAIKFKRPAALGFWFVPDDPVDLLSQEELVAAFLSDPALAPPIPQEWNSICDRVLASRRETIA
jgi:hypothetical protein